MQKSKEQIYYTYLFLNPLKPGKFKYNEHEFEYEPFYVGKGKGKRWQTHLKEENIIVEKNKHKNNIIKQILSINKNPILIKLYENISEKEAFDYEIYLISLIGRSDLNTGPLTNLTAGGDGCVKRSNNYGRPTSDETKKKISEKIKSLGTWAGDNNPSKTKEHQEMMSKKLKNRIFSDESKLKMSISSTGKTHTLETKRKLSESRIGIKRSDSFVQKIKKANSGKKRTPQVKLKYSLMRRKNKVDFLNELIFIKENMFLNIDILFEKIRIISLAYLKKIYDGQHFVCEISTEELKTILSTL